MADNKLLRLIGPGSMTGLSLGRWLTLLLQNRLRLGLPYLGRVATISMLASVNSIGKLIDNIRFSGTIKRTQPQPPLFVLGVFRSGTTHLHNLLCQDDRFGFINTFQGMNPHTFLGGERFLAPIQQRFYPKSRPFDNVKMGPNQPYEEEFAVAAMCGLSPIFWFVFPRNYARYERYLDFGQATQAEVDRWKQTFLYVVKKLTVKYQKPLVLKSPHNTARVKLLLEMFPDAKFIYVHRHPHEVYASYLNLIKQSLPVVTVQRYNLDEQLSRAVPRFRMTTEAYLAQRSLIPPERLIEVPYTELDADPIATLRRIYEHLELPSFEVAAPRVQAYLDSLGKYQKNTFRQVDDDTKAMLKREWARCFEAWGYDPG
jgi:hypothetical protein